MNNEITPAEKESILSKLCSYDKRNPNCFYEDKEIRDHKESILKNHDGICYCDNCFYGRTPLAEQILKLLGE